MKMRILIHSLYYAPELIGVGKYTGEMAEWLAQQGHEVRVVTAPPFYPEWRIRSRYSAWRYTKEVGCRDGVAVVYRCPLWVPTAQSGLKRVLHLLSFTVSSLPVILLQILWKPDVVISVKPPFFCAPQALIAARFSGAKALLHIQDFEVDAAFALGLLSNKKLRNIALRLERWLLNRFDRVSVISEGMWEHLGRKGVDASRRMLFPNWVDTHSIRPVDDSSPMREELGLGNENVVALYSGNMGEKQGLEVLLEAARQLSSEGCVHFVLCGDGATKQRLMDLSVGLTNVSWMSLQPLDRLNELLNMADIHLLPQRAAVADLVMPSKLTAMLASGRPVVATAENGSQLARVVEGCGHVVAPGDAKGVANAIKILADNRSERERLGMAARSFALQFLDKNVILKKFEQDLINWLATEVTKKST